jgi:hypothetical protein
VTGSGGTVVCEGDVLPSAIRIDSDSVVVEFVAAPDTALSGGAIAGIVLGTVALTALLVAVGVYAYKRDWRTMTSIYDSKLDPMPLLEL